MSSEVPVGWWGSKVRLLLQAGEIGQIQALASATRESAKLWKTEVDSKGNLLLACVQSGLDRLHQRERERE